MNTSVISYYLPRIFLKLKPRSLRNVDIHSSSIIQAGSSCVNVKVGKYSFIGYNSKIYNSTIGSFCSIADDVLIGPSEHPYKFVSTSPTFFDYKDIITEKFSKLPKPKPRLTHIGNDVWIGSSVFIKQGLKLGTGCIIGMNSVVTKDVPPYAIVAGSPATIIKYRFNPDLISLLLSSKWWDLDTKLLQSISKLYAHDPYSFALNCLEAAKSKNETLY